MNEFLKVRLKLTAALEKIDKIYREIGRASCRERV